MKIPKSETRRLKFWNCSHFWVENSHKKKVSTPKIHRFSKECPHPFGLAGSTPQPPQPLWGKLFGEVPGSYPSTWLPPHWFVAATLDASQSVGSPEFFCGGWPLGLAAGKSSIQRYVGTVDLQWSSGNRKPSRKFLKTTMSFGGRFLTHLESNLGWEYLSIGAGSSAINWIPHQLVSLQTWLHIL